MSHTTESSVHTCIRFLKGRLMKPAPFFRHNEKQKAHIRDLIERTVAMGESNSVLLVGPRSSGKSCLIDCVLHDLSCNSQYQESAVVVRLNGLIHTDDTSTLKAMACQLNLPNMYEGCTIRSVAENMSFLLECLKGKCEVVKPIIIILDEFDLFCNHTRQTLLYNLFDVAQSAQAPICVIGLACRLDTTELLEKRVKSRFSNRQIYLFPGAEKLGFEMSVKCCKDLLFLPESICEELCVDSLFVQRWNENISILIDSSKVQEIIHSLYSIDLSERRLRLYLVLLISKLNLECKILTTKEFIETHDEVVADAKCNILGSLSVLEICLIIAMNHHMEVYDDEPFNFEMIYRVYMKFVKQNSLDYMTERSVVMKAFENIINLELVLPVKNNDYLVLKEHQMFKFVLLPEQIAKGIHHYQNLPTKIQQWAICNV